MKFPEKVPVFGPLYTLHSGKGRIVANDEVSDGVCDNENKLIYVNLNDAAPDKIMIHELIHAGFRETGVGEAISEDCEEIITEMISLLMYNTFDLKFKKKFFTSCTKNCKKPEQAAS